MLQKRKRKMQAGLKGMADAMDKLLSSLKGECFSNPGVQNMATASRKLKRLTRATVVDYGTHIKYEAMKSLEVGNVKVHAELNTFLSAWKLNGPKAAGSPLGKLFRKLSLIEGH